MFRQFFNRVFHRQADPSVEKRLKALEDRWDTIETEWNDWYEKFRLLHLRLAKRQKAIELAESQSESVEPDKSELTAPNGGSEGSPTSRFTDSQREWQQKILRQRARM